MRFKTEELRDQYWKLTPKARYLDCYVEYLFWKLFGKEATITCIFYEGGSGIHSIKCRRATDFSTKELTSMQIIAIQEKVNATFPYDVNRPRYKSCKYHKVDDKKISEYKLKDFVPTYHLHMQVWIK